jgi:drug/metabolite transporter (DMT)-like permease
MSRLAERSRPHVRIVSSPALATTLPSTPRPERPWLGTFLAWYFVTVWGSGYVATKVGIQFAAPFTFLALRFALGIILMVPAVILLKPRWPANAGEFGHIVVAGLLVHAVNLGASHYAQYLGLSAGITALILSAQPIVTAIIAARWMQERLAPSQWTGIALGLAGVALIVWHKIDVQAMTLGSLVAVTISLAAITAGTLYQRVFCPRVDLRSAPLVQFAACLAVMAPLGLAFEGLAIRWTWELIAALLFMVIFASILATNALHTLMRRGQPTKVTSLFYLTPIVAVVLEYALFGVVPTAERSRHCGHLPGRRSGGMAATLDCHGHAGRIWISSLAEQIA